jgi:site-specific DNA recombinase
MTRPWLIYTRVSTEDQAEHGISLEAQLTACRAYATARAWAIGEEIADRGVSASTLNRDGVKRVLALMKSGEVAGVIAWRLDRLTRSIRDLLTLLDLVQDDRCGIVSVTESLDTTSPMGRFVVHLLVLIAQWERETIGVRTKAAVAHARKSGWYTGGPVPACTEVVQHGARRKLVPSAGADVLKNAWGWLLSGNSLARVAEMLNAECVPHLCRGTPTPWTPANVRATLLCKQLAGVLTDQASIAKVSAVLAQRTTPTRRGSSAAPGRPAKQPTILSGMMRCPTCDRAMVMASATGRGGKRYRFLRCCGRSKRLCHQKDLKCEPIERAVIEAVQRVMRPGSDYHQALTERIVRARAKLDHAREERVRLTAQREQLSGRITDLALRQQIGAPGWDAALRAVGGELKRTEDQLADLAGTIAAAEVDHSNLDQILAAIALGIENLHQATPDQQRAALLRILSQVRFDHGALLLDLYEPEKLYEPPQGPAVVRIEPGGWGRIPHGKRTVRVRYYPLQPAISQAGSG